MTLSLNAFLSFLASIGLYTAEPAKLDPSYIPPPQACVAGEARDRYGNCRPVLQQPVYRMQYATRATGRPTTALF